MFTTKQKGFLRKLIVRRTVRHDRSRAVLHVEPLEDRTLLSTAVLDPTFGTGGSVSAPVGSAHSEIRGVALQPNGKIVVAGVAFDGAQNDFAVARFNADGTLDPSFNHTGEVLTPFGSTPSAATSVALQPDGKIVVAGRAGTDFAVARYNADGTLDTGFLGTGKVMTAFPGSIAFANGVALQADGKIVVVGDANSGFAVARYNPGGTLDTSFHHSGRNVITFSTDAALAGVAVQPDGKIVLAGTVGNNAQGSFEVVRLNPNGSLDTGFNGSGGTGLSIGAHAAVTAVRLQTDGKIVVGGSSDGSFALARFNASGSLDSGFNGSGAITASFGSHFNTASSLAFEADGKIFLAGTVFAEDTKRFEFAVARFNANGTLDSGFSNGGALLTNLPVDSEANGLAVQPDGKLVLAGSSGDEFALVRYKIQQSTPLPTATTTTLTGSVDHAVFGQAVTFTAVVGVAPGGNGAPSGTVTFSDAGTVLGTVPLVGGMAKWTGTFTVGLHANLTASYSGDANFAGSTGGSALIVQPGATTTALTTSANPATLGQALTFTAHVNPVMPASGVPAGVVVFLDGAVVLGHARLVQGVATLTVGWPLRVGLHHIAAIYFGSINFTRSTSSTLTESIVAPTSTTLKGPASSVPVGQPVVLIATVKPGPAGTPTPTGTITFKDGANVLGTVTLSSGQAKLTFNGPLGVGQHTITALYSGDGDFLASVSLPLTLTIKPLV